MTDELVEESMVPQGFPTPLELLIKIAQVEVFKQPVGPNQEITLLKFHTPFLTFTIPLDEDSVGRLVNDLRGLEGSSRIILARGGVVPGL